MRLGLSLFLVFGRSGGGSQSPPIRALHPAGASRFDPLKVQSEDNSVKRMSSFDALLLWLCFLRPCLQQRMLFRKGNEITDIIDETFGITEGVAAVGPSCDRD